LRRKRVEGRGEVGVMDVRRVGRGCEEEEVRRGEEVKRIGRGEARRGF